jgi:hypothetical protein
MYHLPPIDFSVYNQNASIDQMWYLEYRETSRLDLKGDIIQNKLHILAWLYKK